MCFFKKIKEIFEIWKNDDFYFILKYINNYLFIAIRAQYSYGQMEKKTDLINSKRIEDAANW